MPKGRVKSHRKQKYLSYAWSWVEISFLRDVSKGFV